MRTPLVVLVVLAALVAAIPAASKPTTTSVAAATPPASALLPHGAFGPRQLVFFGYVKSMTRSRSGYVARIDPSLMLTGVTGTRAAVEDGALKPGEPIPNDYYELNETHRLLSYRIAATAHVTVLTNPGTGPTSTIVPVSEFAQIVKGGNPRKRPGLWAAAGGFWIRVQGDRALALDQAYRP